VGGLLLLWLLGGLFCGAVCASIGSGKGRSGFGWFFIGLVFGLVGVLVAWVASPLGNERQDRYNERLR